MSARSGMADLVQRVRDMTNAGTAEYMSGTASYWDDDHIQGWLDANRFDVYHELLTVRPRHAGGGTIQYLEYHSRYGDYEQTTGGTAIFIVEDATGADAGTAGYSVDYQRGIVTFTADQGGTAYYITGRSYDVAAAAADLLTAWAAHEKLSFDFSTDGQSFKRSQKSAALLQMAEEYRAQARPAAARLTRSDEANMPQVEGPYSQAIRKHYGDPWG